MPTSSDTTLPHCQNIADYDMTDGSYNYTPSQCRHLAQGESLIKKGTLLYFPSFLEDIYVKEAGPLHSCTPCGGRSIALSDGSCRCEESRQYFANDVDLQKVVFNHGYKVALGTSSGAIFSSSSVQQKTSTGSSDLLTVFKQSLRAKDAGMQCKIGGKDKVERSPTGIKGTLAEYLACAGVKLDDYASSDGVKTPQDHPHPPHLRICGVKLRMALNYIQKGYHGYDYDGDVCEVTVEADEIWNTMNHMAYSQVPDVHTGVGSYRYRYMYGVSIEPVTVGQFYEFDYNMLVTTLVLVAQLVILGIPPQIVSFIALYFVGAVSVIYSAAANQRLSVRSWICGVCSRLMSQVQAYRGLSDEQGVTVEKNLTKTQIQGNFSVIFKKDLADGTLSQNELASLQDLYTRSLDHGGDGSVGVDEFLVACSGNEDVGIETLAKILDQDRKKQIGERLFSDLDLQGDSSKKQASVVPSGEALT